MSETKAKPPGNSLDKEKAKVIKIILSIESRLEGWETNLEIDGKNLEKACVEHSSWLAYYDELSSEMRYAMDFAEYIEERVRGELFRNAKENSTKTYTDNAINTVINANPIYGDIHELVLESQEMYSKCVKVVKAFEQRSYMLNNIVKIREKELEHVIIRT